EGLADVTGLALLYVLEVQPGVLWEARPDVVRRLCAQSIAAGTLAFRRTTLRPGVTYPDIDVGEDVTFLQRAVAAGRRLKRLDVPGLFVCVRHGRNTWHFVPGRSLGKSGWRRVQLEETRLPSDLVHRYQDALRPDGAARRSA
ncbi:MAG TPA: hypothetical protein VFP15_05285, partial [Gemmatimonadaceae bacterium]|nr:hypothetical protein [Gemmatimonadaceae bacterium]